MGRRWIESPSKKGEEQSMVDGWALLVSFRAAMIVSCYHLMVWNIFIAVWSSMCVFFWPNCRLKSLFESKRDIFDPLKSFNSVKRSKNLKKILYRWNVFARSDMTYIIHSKEKKCKRAPSDCPHWHTLPWISSWSNPDNT